MERSLRVWSDGAFCCGFKEVFFLLVRLQTGEVGPGLGSVQLREEHVLGFEMWQLPMILPQTARAR